MWANAEWLRCRMASLPNIGGTLGSMPQSLAHVQNPSKLGGVPQTTEPISAISGPKFPYCEDMWGRYCCLKSFFQMSVRALIAKI